MCSSDLLLARSGAERRGLIDERFEIYLPLVEKPELHWVVGVENEGGCSNLENWLLPGMRVKVGANWAWIESIRGVYDWSTTDNKLCGHRPNWITVKMTPTWALPYWETWNCKLPALWFYADFA